MLFVISRSRAQPVAFEPQAFLIEVALNRDSRDMAGILDQLQIGGTRATRFTIMNGESPEDFTLARKQGSRPHCTNSKRQEQMTIMIPDGVVENIGHIYRLSSINSCAAGSTFWTDKH